jgi:hypothetical protein
MVAVSDQDAHQHLADGPVVVHDKDPLRPAFGDCIDIGHKAGTVALIVPAIGRHRRINSLRNLRMDRTRISAQCLCSPSKLAWHICAALVVRLA